MRFIKQYTIFPFIDDPVYYTQVLKEAMIDSDDIDDIEY